jgi:hypothetical protein
MGLLSRIKTWVEGDTLTAADLNAEFNNITNNLAPTYIDDDSATEAGMQATVDPYPASSESLATTLAGEIERLRYVIKQITGESQWYIDPDSTIASMASDIASLGSLSNPNGAINNLSLSATVSGKALTVNVLCADATTPTTGTPVTINFRAPTATGSGTFNRTITGALSVVLTSGSTLGFTAAETGRIYIWAIDNAGTVELAVSRRADTFLEQNLVSTTAEGGAGAADSATVMYSTTARSNVPCRCIGYIEITTGGTAGEWDNAPTKLQVMGPGVKRTGDVIQIVEATTTTSGSTATVIPNDNTIPQNTEGGEVLTKAITPSSAINKLYIDAYLPIVDGSAAAVLTAALFQDTAANALTSACTSNSAANYPKTLLVSHSMTAGIASSTTFKLRFGPNGNTGYWLRTAGGDYFNGTATARIKIAEVMA